MMPENNYLSRLLPLEELFILYSKIGDTINTDIDLMNANYDYLAKDNSIQLLKNLNFIIEESDYYSKKKEITSQDVFAEELLSQIRTYYCDKIQEINNCSTHYDEKTGSFFGYRNDLLLDDAGLLMLLNDLGYLQLNESCFYIKNHHSPQPHQSNEHHSSSITLIELENSLLFKKKLGEEAEQKVLLFEKEILSKEGIEKEPIQVSHQDSSAGYDIVSYLRQDSAVPDKFIEVKSCKDDEAFYMSKNEIEKARQKDDNYYLYLFNRTTEKITIIRNPYRNIIQKEDWIKDPQIFRIKRI